MVEAAFEEKVSEGADDDEEGGTAGASAEGDEGEGGGYIEEPEGDVGGGCLLVAVSGEAEGDGGEEVVKGEKIPVGGGHGLDEDVVAEVVPMVEEAPKAKDKGEVGGGSG